MRDRDLPRADERELVVERDRVYELDREDSRALAAVGAFAECRNTISIFRATPWRTFTIRDSSGWLTWVRASAD